MNKHSLPLIGRMGMVILPIPLKKKDRLIEYMMNQEDRHKIQILKEKFIELQNEHGIKFDEMYLINIQPLWGCEGFL